jgi:zinc transport system substrate-binding protein
MKNEPFRLSFPRTIFFFCMGFLLFLLVAPSSGHSQPKLKIVTTLFPWQEFARSVGEEKVQVDLLLPPGAEPHNWEPKPSAVTKINQADIFIYTGRAMEPWVEDLLKATKSSRLQVLEASRGIALLETKDHTHGAQIPSGRGQGGKNDPHIWLDFSLDMNIVEMIASAFSEKDPANATHYRANAVAYKSKLDALDRKYGSSLSQCRQRQMILGGHSAFGYLTQRYGLQQIALYGISPNAEPTPKKLAEVVQAAKNHKVKFIFFESLVNPKLAQVLAKEAGLGTLLLHTGHNVTKEQIKNKTTFLELMEINLNNLRRGLGCDK